MKNKLLAIVAILLVLYGVAYLAFNSRDPLLVWDWSEIDTSQKSFPKSFVWGAASAAHQV